MLSKKKTLALVSMVVGVLSLATFLLPIFMCEWKEGETVTYGYRDFFASLNALPSTFTPAVMWILLGIYFAVLVLAEIFLVRSLIAKPLVGDKEDKTFVFGHFFLVVSFAFFALTFLGTGSYGPMAIGIVLLFYAVGCIVYHFKKLSDI